MGPWHVLVSPCFRENVVVTCKIGSFLHLQFRYFTSEKRNCFFFFLEIKFKNGAHLKKGLLLAYFSHFLVTGEKLQKFLQHVSDSHIYTHFAHPIDFFALPIVKKIQIYQVWFLFGVIPGVDSYSCHFGTINK